jgi:hypothetical protein
VTRTAIYTAVAGAYDYLRPQTAQARPVDWHVFTDDPELATPEPWQRRDLLPHPQGPRMAAKVVRCRPRDVLRDYDYAIWIDANMVVTNPEFASEAIASIRNGMATWAHPQRRCVYDEAEASLRLAPRKYAHLPIRAQVAAYAAEGHPVNARLYATGTTAWDLHDDRAMELGAAWLTECEKWTYQDQLSLPVVCRRAGFEPGVFPHQQINGTVLSNPWLRIEEHLRDD